MLEYLHHCFHLWVIFDRIDTGHDGHISIQEFRAAIPLLNHWGLDVTEDNADATFNEIDADHAGQILFGELCDWAIAKQINVNEEGHQKASKEKQGVFETERFSGASSRNAGMQDTSSGSDSSDGDRELIEELEGDIDKHTLFIEERLRKEKGGYMGFCEFLRMLRHFDLYPQMISMHTARLNWSDACSGSKNGVGAFPEFVESLCRACFMYLSVYGNCVQQTTTSKRKFLWIITWLQSKCRARSMSISVVREPLVTSLDQMELHDLIMGGAMLRPLARGRQFGNRLSEAHQHYTI